MPRNDDLLYTGMHSASFVKQLKLKDERQEERAGKRAEFIPVAEEILAIVEQERETTKLNILKQVKPGIPKDDVKEVLTALNLYDESMVKLNAKFFNILRLVKKAEVMDEN